jgi:small conductance mechanosensitive channel
MRRFLILLLLSFLVAMTVPPVAAQEGEAPPDTSVSEEPAEEKPSDADQARELLATIQAELDSIAVLQVRAKKAEEEERQLMRVNAQRHLKVVEEGQPQLFKILEKMDFRDPDARELQEEAGAFLIKKYDIYEDAVQWWARDIGFLREMRSSTPPEELGDLETRITAARTRLDELLPELAVILEAADELDLDTTKNWERFDRAVHDRAENLVGRMQIAVDSRDNLRKKLEKKGGLGTTDGEPDPDRVRLEYAEERVTGVAKSLETTVDILASRGHDTTVYRQIIFKTTGEISDKVLNPRVLLGLLKDAVRSVGEWLGDNGPTILVRLIIVIVTIILFRFLFRLLWWALRVTHLVSLTKLMVQLGNSLVNPIATTVGLFAGLWIIGANPATLLTGAGVAGVIIGFALQDSLANMAAGFFILATRPFDVDDTIRTGTVTGTVKAMWIANTTIVTFDGRRLLIPNRKIWADIIENRSVEPLRRADIVVKVGFDEDINRVIDVLHDLLRQEGRVLDHPEARVFVAGWMDSWAEVAVRPWTRNEDWWPLVTDLPRLVALRFREEGIEIPYPKMDMGGGQGLPPSPPDKGD